MMKKATRMSAIAVALMLLVGCRTLNDVKSANQLIRADNELAQLASVRQSGATNSVVGSVDQSVQAQLVIAGDEALKQAQLLRDDAGVKRRLEALSWYRIAATAYWQSRAAQSVDKMFQAAQDGTALCAELGDKAPDRDGFYLKLVIPFAAFEASANTPQKGLLLDLGEVEFGDASRAAAGVIVIKDAYSRLQTMRNVLQEIDACKDDPVLVKHPSLQAYYDDNRSEAHDFFENARAKLWTRLSQLKEHFPATYAALNFTVEQVAGLKF